MIQSTKDSLFPNALLLRKARFHRCKRRGESSLFSDISGAGRARMRKQLKQERVWMDLYLGLKTLKLS